MVRNQFRSNKRKRLNKLNKCNLRLREGCEELPEVLLFSFLKLKNFVGKANLNEASEDFVAEKMEQLWDNHLEPLLKEYVRGL